MRIRLRRWPTLFIVAAIGVAVACVWATRKTPVPEIPRVESSAFTEREVQMDVFTAAHHAELEPRSAAEFLGELADHPLAARHALLLRSEICRRQGRTSYADYLAGRAADTPDGTWPDPLADPIRSRDRSLGGRLDEAARLLRDGQPGDAELLLRPLTARPFAADPRAFVGLAEARAAQGHRKGAL